MVDWTLEVIAQKALIWVAGTSPILGMIILILGIILLACELFIKASPSTKDDAWWAAIKSGYLGPFIGLLMTYAKTIVGKFFGASK